MLKEAFLLVAKDDLAHLGENVLLARLRAPVFDHDPALVKLLLKEFEGVGDADFLQGRGLCLARVAARGCQGVVKATGRACSVKKL